MPTETTDFKTLSFTVQVPSNQNISSLDLQDSVTGLLYARGILTYDQAIKISGKERVDFDEVLTQNGLYASGYDAKEDFVFDSK